MPRKTGAPDDSEIEVTPAMVKAGLEFLAENGLNSLTTLTRETEFVIEFYKVVASAKERA